MGSGFACRVVCGRRDGRGRGVAFDVRGDQGGEAVARVPSSARPPVSTVARGPVRDGHVPGGGEEFVEPGGVEAGGVEVPAGVLDERAR
ncbi:hypothetical protein ACIA6D_28970 [Streptomyces cacaoi]|uniref:hypothetical protein n=1 Tax=Streptomyces cacaoi TaxID=1898 RepID=UPI003748EAC8